MKNKDNEINDSTNFINRELSWLEFNERVLEEAQDTGNPLLERLKFTAIASSNLDEFFMVRVGSLWDQVLAGFNKPDPSGYTPKEQLLKISVRSHKMIYDQYNCYSRSVLPSLRKEKIYFLKTEKLNDVQRKYIENFYNKNVFPVITPMVVDKSRPFPLILNKSLNIGVLIKNKNHKDDYIFATVQVPSVLQRLIEIPSCEGEKCFVFLEDVIKLHINTLFIGHDIITMGCFRLTRNADLSINEEGAEDLLEAIEQSVRQRKWGAAVRLEIEKDMDEILLNILKNELELTSEWIYEIKGPLDLTFLMKIATITGFENLKFISGGIIMAKALEKDENLFELIAQKDILLHHPYESFKPVIDLVQQSARDPHVLAIKQTLYRVSGNSPIVKALMEAAENGKQVTVLVELKARFDEENNINWAKRLEQAGCHVIYGLVGLKTHCKILLIVRKEEESIKRYVHLSTGNYNDVTANIYTDISLFTSNSYIGADASALFNMLSGYSQITGMYKINIAPITLRDKFLYLIERETENALKGKAAKIIVKVNSLVDENIIEALYKASGCGVEIELIVRGICCLRPGIKGLSDKIRVRSIVGRFLEHSRIFYFYNGGDELLYLSSADWMQRNLDRRVEILFPIEDQKCREKLKNILKLYLKDTLKSRMLNKDGTYSRVDKRGKETFNSQHYFYTQAFSTDENSSKRNKLDSFKPIVSSKDV